MIHNYSQENRSRIKLSLEEKAGKFTKRRVLTMNYVHPFAISLRKQRKKKKVKLGKLEIERICYFLRLLNIAIDFDRVNFLKLYF